MPGMTGTELQAFLKTIKAAFPIIFMSGNATQTDIISAWRGGAVDYILKPFTPTQITDALDKQFDALKTDQTQPDSVRKPLINIAITKREAEVLLLLGNGHPQIEVAKILGISVRTVKMYRSFLKDKLGLNSTAKLAKYCHQYQESIELVAKGNSSRLR
jgi:FixJ family two-component response regulator